MRWAVAQLREQSGFDIWPCTLVHARKSEALAYLRGFTAGTRTGYKAVAQDENSFRAQLVDAVKLVQRVSPSWKQAWFRFIAANVEGRYDPTGHTTEFLVSFIELLGAQSLQAMEAQSLQDDNSWQSGGNLQSADVVSGGGYGKCRRLNRKTRVESPLTAPAKASGERARPMPPTIKKWSEC